jgi:DNA-binding GntR family transcriptional regulator
VRDKLAPRPDLSIADVLRESIRQRMLPPGMPLIQQTIADAMGVSRIPVREALQRLASEGLVVFGDDGVRVTELSPAEIDELWSLRAVIESSMAEATVR